MKADSFFISVFPFSPCPFSSSLPGEIDEKAQKMRTVSKGPSEFISRPFLLSSSRKEEFFVRFLDNSFPFFSFQDSATKKSPRTNRETRRGQRFIPALLLLIRNRR